MTVSRLWETLRTYNVSNSLHLLIYCVGSVNLFVYLASVEAVEILATCVFGRQCVFHLLSFELIIRECRIHSVLGRAHFMLLSISWILNALKLWRLLFSIKA